MYMQSRLSSICHSFLAQPTAPDGRHVRTFIEVMRLSQAWREVKVAGTRSPDTINAELLSSDAIAMSTEETPADVHAVVR